MWCGGPKVRREASVFGKATAGEFNENHDMVEAAEAAPYYLPTLIAGIAASLGIIVGSIGPWLQVFVISANGLDIDGWGNATLTLGAVSGIALISQWDSVRTTSSIRWAVPVAWGVFIAGVASLAVAVINIIRFMSTPTEVFGAIFGVQVGWGLWLVALSSLVLSLAAAIVAVKVGKDGTQGSKSSPAAWAAAWGSAALIGSAGIMLCAIAYVWARHITGYDDAFWLRLFEHLQDLGRQATV